MPIILLFVLLLTSCGDNKNSPAKLTYYVYGNEPLPGNLPPLDETYSPLFLSRKDFGSYVPLNFISQRLTLTFDASAKRTYAKSIIRFDAPSTGRPYFELMVPTLAAKLDGSSVTTSKMSDPESQGQSYWALGSSVVPSGEHELELTYELPADRLSYSDGGIRLLSQMTDLNGKFFEYWAPVGFEGDAFSMILNLKILNSTSSHQIFTNGEVTTLSSSEWLIAFPKYFTNSSFYLHLTNNPGLTVRRFTYSGLEKNIPVTVYSTSPTLVDNAVAILPQLFSEFENDYGAYPHENFLAYMNATGGGMEYVAATITSLGSLDHELFHSWFARGVIPADGRSGWIDEAMASWRDNGYFQSSAPALSRDATNLAAYSSFRKTTPRNSYVDGRMLLADLDREFAAFGGMKHLMRVYFERYKYRIMTNEEFWNFLNVVTGINVDEYFKKYTLAGETSLGEIISEEADDIKGVRMSKHPTPLTENEILRLR